MELCLMKYGPGRSLVRALTPPSFGRQISRRRPSSTLLRSGRFSFSSLSQPSRSTANAEAGNGAVGKAYDGLLVDAGGTLLQLQRPVAETYASIGSKYGLSVTAPEIKQGFKRAFSAPWPEKLRYQGDGRPFWKLVVSEATGCKDHDYFEEVYQYYANGDVWCLPDGAHESLALLKDRS